MIRKIKNIGLGIAAVAAMVGGWSCATDDTTDAIYVESTGEIRLSTSVMAPVTTRASVDASTVASEISEFGLYCYTDQRGTLYDNQSVTMTNGEWNYGTTEKWYANEVFDYKAYYPYIESGVSSYSNGAITLTGFSSDGDTPLLFACETVTNSDVVELGFTHALAAVGFSVMGDPDYEVKSITIGSIYDMADVAVDSDGTATWSNHKASSATNSFTVDIIEDAAPYARTDEMYGYPKNITADDGYVMAIPQTFGDYAYAQIIYDAPQEDGTVVENVVRYLKLSDYGSLESNTLYNYTISFGEVQLTYINLNKYDGLTGDALETAFLADLQALAEDESVTDLVFVGDYNEELFELIYGSWSSDLYFEEMTSSILHNYTFSTIDLSAVDNFPSTLPAGAFLSMDGLSNSMSNIVAGEIDLDLFYAGEYDDLMSTYSTIETIILPDNVTELGDGAFAGCILLSEVNVSNVTDINQGTFASCLSLTELDISLVTSIDKMSFWGCLSLTDLDFSSVMTIAGSGLYAPFVYCYSFETLSFPELTDVTASVFSGILYNGSNYLIIDLPKVTTIYHNSLPDDIRSPVQVRLTTSANINVLEIATSYTPSTDSYSVAEQNHEYGQLVLHENKRSGVVEGEGAFGVDDGYLNRLNDVTVVDSDYGYIKLVSKYADPLVDMYGYPYIIDQGEVLLDDSDREYTVYKVYILDEENGKVALVSESVSVSTSYKVTFQIPYYSFQTDYFRWADISFVDDNGDDIPDSSMRQVDWVDISTVSFKPTATTVE